MLVPLTSVAVSTFLVLASMTVASVSIEFIPIVTLI